MTLYTNMSFEDVEQKVNEGYQVQVATKTPEGRYVKLWKSGKRNFIELQYYMESKEELEKVREEYL